MKMKEWHSDNKQQKRTLSWLLIVHHSNCILGIFQWLKCKTRVDVNPSSPIPPNPTTRCGLGGNEGYLGENTSSRGWARRLRDSYVYYYTCRSIWAVLPFADQTFRFRFTQGRVLGAVSLHYELYSDKSNNLLPVKSQNRKGLHNTIVFQTNLKCTSKFPWCTANDS